MVSAFFSPGEIRIKAWCGNAWSPEWTSGARQEMQPFRIGYDCGRCMEAPNEVKIILWRPSHNKSTTFLDLKRSNERRRIENLIHPYPVCGIVRWWSFTSATIWSLVLQPYVGGVNGCACGSYISAEHIIRHMTDLETLLTVNASQMASLKNRTFFFCLLSLGLKGCSWDAAVKWTEIGS